MSYLADSDPVLNERMAKSCHVLAPDIDGGKSGEKSTYFKNGQDLLGQRIPDFASVWNAVRKKKRMRERKVGVFSCNRISLACCLNRLQHDRREAAHHRVLADILSMTVDKSCM